MSPFASSSRRPWRGDRRGVAALEFAVVGGIFFTMFLGAIEIGRYFATQQALRNLMAESLRQWQVQIGNMSGVTPDTIGDLCSTLATPSTATVPLLQSANVGFTGQQCSMANGVITLQLTITYPFAFHGPLLPVSPTTLSETSQLSF